MNTEQIKNKLATLEAYLKNACEYVRDKKWKELDLSLRHIGVLSDSIKDDVYNITHQKQIEGAGEPR